VIDLLMKLMKESREEDAKMDFSLEDMAQNLVVFLVAGHETVVGGMIFMMKFLGENERIFKKLCEDVKGVMGRKKEKGRDEKEVTYEDLKEMKYCIAVVKESLRCLPPAAMGMREVKKETEIGGYKLFPGELILLNFKGIHEEGFSEDEKFMPERWMDEEGEQEEKRKEDRSNFVAFSGGERLCIGMRFALLEMQVLLVNIIMKGYWWTLAPDQDLGWLPRDGLSCKYKSGLQIKFHQINSF